MAHTPSFSTMRKNLIELRVHLTKEEPPLVAHPFSQRLYARKSIQGRIWFWFYTLVTKLSSKQKNWQERRHQNILQKTQTAFATSLSAFQKDLEAYEKNLVTIYKGENVEEKTWFRLGNRIVLYHATLSPFWQLCRNPQTEKIRSFAKQFFSPTKGLDCESHTVKTTISDKGSRYVYIAWMSNETGIVPAIDLFRFLSEKTQVNSLTRPQKQWLQALTKRGKKKPDWNHIVHRAFLVMASAIQKEKAPHTLVGTWALFLDNLGCGFVQKHDNEQVGWRQSTLRKGLTLRNHEREWKLGDIITDEENPDPRFRRFALANDDENIIVFPDNPFLTHSMPFRIQQPFGVRPMEILDVCPYGRFYVQKRCIRSLAKQKWDRNQFLQVGSEQNRQLMALANLGRFYWARQHSPKEIDKNHLFFDKKNFLNTSIHIEPDTEFHLEKIETLFRDIANDDFFVFSFLMHVSGIYQHPLRSYFFQFLENYVKTGDIASAKPMNPEEYDKPEEWLHEKGEQLCKQMDALVEKYFAKKMAAETSESVLSEEDHWKKSVHEDETQEIREDILDSYEKSGGITILLPSILDHALQNTALPTDFVQEYKPFIDLLQQYEKQAGQEAEKKEAAL